jgi:hypothetical protein
MDYGELREAGVALVLQAVDVAGPLRWRWLLTDEQTGVPLADHQVNLDPAADEVVRFGNLYGYARWHAAPDRRTADESRIVAQAGAWAGRELLGEAIGTAISEAAPVTVRVSVPPEAASVLLWPLELAHAKGTPLASRGDVTLVYDVAPVPAAAKAEVAGTLRVLAVFSQPTETSVLALRRERYALGQLIRRIAARQRASVELKVVQYGVTRDRLGEIADSGDGWDVLHLSGHGGRGVFLLEHADGSPDPVDTAELVRLLRPARRRVKLAVVSACQSAADVTAETMRLIGLADQAEQLEGGAAEPTGTPAASLGVAQALVKELDCAVVAMRYPVTDDFAIAFGEEFYEHLLSRGHPVDVAAARAVARAAAGGVSAARPAVSLATPGVFGARAAGLALTAPRGTPELDPAEKKMAHFLDEPERFVGRAQAMAAASAALASGSSHAAVLLHGMAGAGKTACALELAYRHQDAFAAAAFWQAPTRDDEFAGALASLAVALEVQLGGYGFTMTGHIGTVAALEAFMPRLRRVLQDSGVLLVLDNLETLLTPEGTWRDPRWSPLIAALCGHRGESRLVMTSRIPPAALGPGVLVQPVHALSLDEAVALARELPNLSRLLHADASPVRAGTDATVNQDRERVRRVLRVVQGHPKLLEFADAAAADQTRLDAQLDAAEAAAAGQGLDAFFRDGASTLDPDQFLAALTTWTTTALAVLPPPARLLAEFLACLEDDDRRSVIIEANWGDLWRRLEVPGDPPAPGLLLEALTAAALIQPKSPPAAGDGTQPSDHAASLPVTYRVHPGVAAAIHAAAENAVRDAADTELATFWRAVAVQAQGREGGEDSGRIVHAGLAAAPYLLRRRDWHLASIMLERAIVRDASPGVIQVALPALRRIAAATSDPADYTVLARALRTADPAEAEKLLRAALSAAVEVGDYRLAVGIAGQLIIVLRVTGRLGDALELAAQSAAYTSRAGLGPWTQLADQGRRLQILALMGEHRQVLTEIGELRTRMREMPVRRGENEAIDPWNAREATLDTGHSSALALGEWQQCLEINAETLASKQQRGAGAHEIARSRFNDAGPLIRLGRLAEAGPLLRDCQQVFEDHRETDMLARILGTRAGLEDKLGHRETAVDFARTALRLSYARPAPREIAIGHHNLALYLWNAGGDPAGQRAHRAAAVLIYQLTGMTHYLATGLYDLAAELRQDPGTSTGRLPATLAEVIRVAEQTDGVRLADLLTALQPDAQAAEAALAQILRTAADLPPDD